jgi:hypothetical protein
VISTISDFSSGLVFDFSSEVFFAGESFAGDFFADGFDVTTDLTMAR